MTTAQEALRILRNLTLLLQEGQFPGRVAPIVIECHEHLNNVIKGIENVEAAAEPSSASSQPSANEAGVGSSDVRHPRRKNSRKQK
jgi:hypothetical protein